MTHPLLSSDEYQLDASTVQGVAEHLAREKGGLPREHWAEALTLLDVVYEKVVLPPVEVEGE